MGGEKELDILISSMQPVLDPNLYVFASVPLLSAPQGLVPLMAFQEPEGTTLIVVKHLAETYQLDFEFPCRRITLNIHSALDAVGFLARITTALAQHDMGVNPVSGFYHDHLFVPDGRQDDAMRVLRDLAAS